MQYLTTGPLEQTDKCKFHGDEDIGLAAHKNLYQLLQPSRLPIIREGSQWGFLWFKVPYHFYSVGVAANPKYGAVSTRQGNDYENRSSHFEIKFKRANTKKGMFLSLNTYV